MPTKNQTWALVIVIFVLSFAVSVARGDSGPSHLLSSLSYVVTLTSVVLLIWEKWLWRFRIFHPLLTARPDVRGTWKGELRSSWADPDTGLPATQIEAYLVIRQTFSSIDARMFSLESSSISLSANLIRTAPELHELFIVYRNEPRVLLRDQSPIHFGGMRLDIRGTKIRHLDGSYWTDRLTKGEAYFFVRIEKASLDFNDAASSFG
jgi:hypothetical protein